MIPSDNPLSQSGLTVTLQADPFRGIHQLPSNKWIHSWTMRSFPVYNVENQIKTSIQWIKYWRASKMIDSW